jgi:uncharacterized membrane protein YeaQ/YmgE (transglycosylase-associated protein family)
MDAPARTGRARRPTARRLEPAHYQGDNVSTAGIFTALLAGIVIGALGRLIIPGRQAIGWILTFVVGLLGAFIGGFLAEGMDMDVWWQILIAQAVVAAILVLLVNSLVRSRVRDRRASRKH